MEYRYTAIILAKKDIGEADRIYTMYTREAGKVRAIARGVRKPHARLAPHLENFHRSGVMVMRTRGMGNFKSAIIEEDRSVLHSSYDAMTQAFFVAEFIDRHIEIEEQDVVLFDKLDEYLNVLGGYVQKEKIEKGLLLSGVFLFQVLDHLGHGMEVKRCVACGKKLQPEQHFISIEQGGVLCGLCGQSMLSEDIQKISMESIKFLRLLQVHPIRTVLKIAISKKDERWFISFVKNYGELIV